jgi:hypothetical protein
MRDHANVAQSLTGDAHCAVAVFSTMQHGTNCASGVPNRGTSRGEDRNCCRGLAQAYLYTFARYRIQPARTAEEIRDAEAKLNVVFPASLRELWGQSNGLIDRYGGWFVWSTEIVKRNLEMRTFPGFEQLFMPFDPLLFFGDEGSGDLFFFAICGGKIRYEFVFRWDHETDSRILEEHHLKTFVEKFIAPPP